MAAALCMPVVSLKWHLIFLDSKHVQTRLDTRPKTQHSDCFGIWVVFTCSFERQDNLEALQLESLNASIASL